VGGLSAALLPAGNKIFAENGAIAIDNNKSKGR
jgi:hypothetical protein